MRFVDLFAGLGGFNIALTKLGHQCVFASEIDLTLRELYEKNFGIKPEGDIQLVNVADIPPHEILCAGFPCQPFSRAGTQQGFGNPKLGNLYVNIINVVKCHHPKYLILENVPNFERHDDGQTWKHIKGRLEDEGYEVLINKLSPHRFGIPQIRDRVYIVGNIDGLKDFKWPSPCDEKQTPTIDKYLVHSPKDTRKLTDYINQCLDVWQAFLDNIPTNEKVPHPLWSMEFGATYPYEKTTPSRMSYEELKQYRGIHGQPLSEAVNLEQLYGLLPSHARRDQDIFPDWKIEYIKKNRDFYAKHKNWLDKWIPKIHKFPSSLQKLEWNCQAETNRKIRSYIIQIRPSGVRVKRPTTFPSLVAMTATQVPIIPWENRYITPTECLRLQSMDGTGGLKMLPESENKAYEALGNAINVKVALLVANALLSTGETSQNNAQEILKQITIPVEASM